MNGLLPLIMSSTLEFENEDEVMATLVYEKLEQHCSVCLMLDHEMQDFASQENAKHIQKDETRSFYQSLSKKEVSYRPTRSRGNEE